MTADEIYGRLNALALREPLSWLGRLWPHRRREIADAMASAGVETEEEFLFALAVAQQARQPKPKPKRNEGKSSTPVAEPAESTSVMQIVKRAEFDPKKTQEM